MFVLGEMILVISFNYALKQNKPNIYKEIAFLDFSEKPIIYNVN